MRHDDVMPGDGEGRRHADERWMAREDVVSTYRDDGVVTGGEPMVHQGENDGRDDRYECDRYRKDRKV